MRISKEPDVRRTEILDAAEALFSEAGYEKTAVSDIVRKVGVAQGTFYYYFASKEAVLEAVLERRLDAVTDAAVAVAGDRAMDAGTKLQILLARLFAPSVTGPAPGSFDNANNIIHDRLEQKFVARFLPILTRVVRQGVAEGSFHTAYPEEITEILLWGIQKYMHRHQPQFGRRKVYSQKVSALTELLERTLGVPAGSFRFGQ